MRYQVVVSTKTGVFIIRDTSMARFTNDHFYVLDWAIPQYPFRSLVRIVESWLNEKPNKDVKVLFRTRRDLMVHIKWSLDSIGAPGF